MKRIERPTYRIAPRTGIIVIAAMAFVALSLTATRAAVGSGIGAAGNNDSGIRPFRITFADADLAELRRRIAATRWPEKETVSDHSQGIPLAMIRELAQYWATDYDWRKAEAKLNAVPQFITNLDGLDIHFIHVRSKHENAMPLIVTHGWPGSIIEQLKIIDPLVNPTAYGGSASDAFDVVIPSMPGYGFSGKPTTTGWGPERMARAWAQLMTRLGYTRYVAQGGDWGAFVVDQMGLQAPAGLLAIHTNMPATVPAAVDKALLAGGPAPAGLSAEERRAYEQLERTFKQVDYARLMGSRPQTLYGIADSPVGLASWLLDHNDADGQPAAAVATALNRTASNTGELTRDEILDNITLYWLTNTGVSSSRLYWEYKGGFFNAKGVSIPVAVSVFPGEQYEAPRSWTERAYPKLIYYNKLEKGGHFAAWEQPHLLATELRAAFRSLRSSAQKDEQVAPLSGLRIPDGYRDWKLISVAREEGELDDIRGILGNDTAIRAYRDGTLPFPDGTVIARLAWAYQSSEENDRAFGRPQSFVAGPPKNGVQFMVKDAKKYASTGGWGFAHFNDGRAADETVHNTCFTCHQAARTRDFVFTRYAR